MEAANAEPNDSSSLAASLVISRTLAQRQEKRPLVLVADDDMVTTQIIEGALAQIGFRAAIAHDGEGVMQKIREHTPDLILLDVSLPDGSGIEICRQLQMESGMSQIPVIFISDHEELAIKVAGFDAGGVDYITKPLAVREVIARVRTHIRLKRGYEALAELQAQRIQKLAAAQEAFMPRAEDIPEARFQVSFVQVLKAGGDFYDVIPVAENVIDYVVADASGHDLGASFWTAALKTLLCEYSNAVNSPREVLHLVNSALLRILPPGVFFTIIYARLNRASRRLSLVNAAHPPAILLRADRSEPVVVAGEGDVVGAYQDAVFDCRELAVATGDRLFLYSDGLIDTTDTREGGMGGLQDVLSYGRDLPLVQAVHEAVEEYASAGCCQDDIVLLGVDI
ncbi:MAG: SpoIIE family protein phosphatase [Candidatus Korobacteraceae bacterium]